MENHTKKKPLSGRGPLKVDPDDSRLSEFIYINIESVKCMYAHKFQSTAPNWTILFLSFYNCRGKVCIAVY